MTAKSKPLDKNPTLEPVQDFYLLRREGIGFIERTGKDRWTDYNVHDPGITILEALCSFHLLEAGVEHQDCDVAGVAGPDGLVDLGELARANADRLPPMVLSLYTHPSPIEVWPIT